MNKIKKTHIEVFVCIALLPLSLEAATYRWTDLNGIVQYSNSIPASDAQLGHVELSKSGFKKKVVISSKKNKELKELAEIRKIQKIIANKNKKEKAAQEEEEIRLLSIYSSVEEVKEAYNSKLRRAQLTIDMLKSRHKKQSTRLETLERNQERSKNVKHRQTLNKQIDDALDNLKIYQQAITENHIEKERVRKEFKTTLMRYTNLIARVQKDDQ